LLDLFTKLKNQPSQIDVSDFDLLVTFGVLHHVLVLKTHMTLQDALSQQGVLGASIVFDSFV
jgi:hypothetical protein